MLSFYARWNEILAQALYSVGYLLKNRKHYATLVLLRLFLKVHIIVKWRKVSSDETMGASLFCV
jgi:hypothetical protein